MRKKCPRYDCQECGMNVEAREYHPYFFCQLKKAGIAQHDFWVTHRDLIAKSGEAGDTQACPECGGAKGYMTMAGWATCTTCSGKPQQSKTCPKCDGYKYIVLGTAKPVKALCPDCKGTGQIPEKKEAKPSEPTDNLDELPDYCDMCGLGRGYIKSLLAQEKLKGQIEVLEWIEKSSSGGGSWRRVITLKLAQLKTELEEDTK